MENNLTKNSQLEKEKEINQIISEITLKHGRSPYSLFIMENYLYEKKEKSKLSSIEIFKILSEKWHKLDLKEKEKYIKISNEEKEKYKCNIKIIKNYYNNQKEKSDSTSFQNFFNFFLSEIISFVISSYFFFSSFDIFFHLFNNILNLGISSFFSFDSNIDL